MLDGWYCRTISNEQAAAAAAQQQQQQQDDNTDATDQNANDDSGTDDSTQEPQGEGGQQANATSSSNSVDYKAQYRYLKGKLKFLIYENEYFQDVMRSHQRRLLKVSRDRTFLLDRLLQYEKPENTSSDSDDTESSDEDLPKEVKKPKLTNANESNMANSNRGRKKKINTLAANVTAEAQTAEALQPHNIVENARPDADFEEHPEGHMTTAEVERHLQLKHPMVELVPERAPATVPTEMFSNEPSLDSESNDPVVGDMGSSPLQVAAEECVPMEYSN